MSKPMIGQWLQLMLLRLGLIVAAASVQAATNSPWSLRAWQSDEGLPDNAVVGIGQTRDGFLWVATQGGLVRFDGSQFHEFSPATAAGTPTGLMRTLYVDRHNRLWMAKDLTALVCMDEGRTTALTTHDGLPLARAKVIVEDAQDNLWLAYSGREVVRVQNGVARSFGVEDGLSGNGECQLATDRSGQVWYASDGRVGVVRKEKFVPLATLPGVQGIGTARSGGVWVCAGLRLFRYAEGRQLTPVAELPASHSPVNPTILYEDRAGALWVGTSDAGLFRFDGSTFEKVATSHHEILCLTEGREGTLWVGTMGGGLNRLRRGIVELQDIGSGFAVEGLRSVCQDVSGTLWAVDRNGGVARDQGKGWRPFSTNEGWTIPSAASIEACPQGGVWIGTQRNGLHLWRDGSLITSLGAPGALVGRIVRSLLASPAGDLWIGTTTESLQRWRAGKIDAFKLPPGSGPIRAMALDAAGTFWAGTASGLLLRIKDDLLAEEPLMSTALPQAIR